MVRIGRGIAAKAITSSRSWAPGVTYPFLDCQIGRELQWRVGGLVQLQREFQWRSGGRVSNEFTLQWQVQPSSNRIQWALEGRFLPVTYTFRYEQRTKTNQFLADVSHMFQPGGSIELNNDRATLRTASFRIDPDVVNDSGELIIIDPNFDHIAVFMDLLVDGSYLYPIQLGLFKLTKPRKSIGTPGFESWAVGASDLTVHLAATVTAQHTIAAGQNPITGTNGAKSILDGLGLLNAFPTTTKTLAAPLTYEVGTPKIQIVNDLLHSCGMYSHWFDSEGVATSREYDNLHARTPDVLYTDEYFIVDEIDEETEVDRFANQIVVKTNDPNRTTQIYSVATNANPDSPTSTVNVGITITKTYTANESADQATIDATAAQLLREAASFYKRTGLTTQPDPRRRAREVYSVEVQGADGYNVEKWAARNWKLTLDNGVEMQHTISRVVQV